MQKPSISFNKLLKITDGNIFRIASWSLFHVLIFVAFIVFGGLKINTNLFSVLPETASRKEFLEPETLLTERLNGSMSILLGHGEFDSARLAALELGGQIEQLADIQKVIYTIDAKALERTQDFFHKFRYRLLSQEFRTSLGQGDAGPVIQQSFDIISSPISMGTLDHINEDPFLLGPARIESFLYDSLSNETALGLREDVLSTEHKGIHWVLVTARTNKGLAIDPEKSAPRMITALAKDLESRNPGLRTILSGVPFHTVESTISSQYQIGILSTLSGIFIIFILVLVFRSIVPLLATNLALLVGVATGLSATAIFCGEMHIFTIVFGTSLIGISIDYSLHFFADRASHGGASSGRQVIARILPGISIGFLTTVVSYIAFTITPFPLLQQIAVFSIAGLLSSYLTVVLLFPLLGGLAPSSSRVPLAMGQSLLSRFGALVRTPFVVKILVLIATVLFVGYGILTLEISNNMSSLYKMSDGLARAESESAEIIQHKSRGVYIISSGSSEDAVRETEYALAQELQSAIESGILDSWTGLAKFIPPKKIQDENLSLVSEVLLPQAKEQFSALGYSEETARDWMNNFDTEKQDGLPYVNSDELQGLPISSLLDILSLGKIGSKYFGVTMVFGIHDMAALKAMVHGDPSLLLVNKVHDVATALDDLSLLSLILVAASYLIIALGLLPRYGIAITLRVCSVPLFASLITMALISISGLQFNIFAVVGLILVPGMGTDFALFYIESGKEKASTMLAITLSMSSSVLSFGLLAFTSFAGVFGITVAVGILISFILTPLVVKESPRNQYSTR